MNSKISIAEDKRSVCRSQKQEVLDSISLHFHGHGRGIASLRVVYCVGEVCLRDHVYDASSVKKCVVSGSVAFGTMIVIGIMQCV